jgi:hypothetical protein
MKWILAKVFDWLPSQDAESIGAPIVMTTEFVQWCNPPSMEALLISSILTLGIYPVPYPQLVHDYPQQFKNIHITHSVVIQRVVVFIRH